MAKTKKKNLPLKQTIPEKKPGLLEQIKLTKTKLIIGSAILIVFILVVISLNLTRIEYLNGKTDPIATVNKEPIYMKQLKTAFLNSALDYQNITNKPLIDDMVNDSTGRKSYQNDLLDSLIDSKVQTIKASKEGIKLSPKELEQVNTDFNTSLTNFQNTLGDTYSTTLFRVDISEYNFDTEFKQQMIDERINNKLSEKQFNTYKLTIPKKDLESVYARGIIMQLTTGKEAEIKKAAKDAYALLKSGAKFEDVLKKYSKYIYKSTDNAHPEIMGWITRNDVPADFANKIFAVATGHFSDVIENPSACSIIFIDKKKTIDVNHLSTAEQQTLINSDNYKKYYTGIIKKWRNADTIHKYITSFKIT
jgi:parvulin-like peptidyl-prolyl isomerase